LALSIKYRFIIQKGDVFHAVYDIANVALKTGLLISDYCMPAGILDASTGQYTASVLAVAGITGKLCQKVFSSKIFWQLWSAHQSVFFQFFTVLCISLHKAVETETTSGKESQQISKTPSLV